MSLECCSVHFWLHNKTKIKWQYTIYKNWTYPTKVTKKLQYMPLIWWKLPAMWPKFCHELKFTQDMIEQVLSRTCTITVGPWNELRQSWNYPIVIIWKQLLLQFKLAISNIPFSFSQCNQLTCIERIIGELGCKKMWTLFFEFLQWKCNKLQTNLYRPDLLIILILSVFSVQKHSIFKQKAPNIY